MFGMLPASGQMLARSVVPPNENGTRWSSSPVLTRPVRDAVVRQDEATFGRWERWALLVDARLRHRQILVRPGGAVVVGPQEGSLARDVAYGRDEDRSYHAANVHLPRLFHG